MIEETFTLLDFLEEVKDTAYERMGLNETSSTKFNFATIDKTEDGIRYIEYWILANAYYDEDVGRFVKIDTTATSFAIQVQAKGTYPGEHELGYDYNTGINIWRNPRAAEVYKDTTLYDYTDWEENNYIGAKYDNVSWGAKNGTWREFGVSTGWSNNFMTDSYGGITVGGAGFEIDGNGIFPFTRLSSSSFTDENNNKYYILGILDNAYHPDMYNDWKCDSNEYGAWFFGLKYPQTSGVKDSEHARFVIMYNDMASIDPTASGYTIEDMDVSDWEVIFEADSSSAKAMVNGTLTTLGAGSDLSNYVQKSVTQGLLKNDGTVDTNSYAEDSDFDTVEVTITYTNNTTETVELYVVPSTP